MELEVSKCYFSRSFNQMWFKLCEDIVYHGELQAISFLGNRLSFTPMAPMGTLNILQNADRRAKRMKSKLYIRCHNHGTIQAITFWAICQNLAF